MILVIAVGNRVIFDRAVRARRMAWSGALTARHLACDAALTSILFCLAIYGAGCGSGSASVAPQPIVTPSGTSTITITTAAMSPTQQPLQLPPIQLTLTVK
jgi:hypothetical protein